MYPSQTSLIPVAVAVVRFIESGHSLWNSWYSYWYLGLPAKFILGPAVPALLVLVHRILPNWSLFDLSLALIALSFVFGAGGWGVLVRRISGKRLVGILACIITVILPWRYLSSLAIEETTFLVARNLLPWGLVSLDIYLKLSRKRQLVITTLVFCLLLLINTGILPILIVGTGALILANAWIEDEKRGKVKASKLLGGAKKTFKILLASLILVTFWYSPGYWLTVLFNPSIGGASAIKVLIRIFDILRSGLPFLLAIVSVYFSRRVKSRYMIFTLTFLSIT